MNPQTNQPLSLKQRTAQELVRLIADVYGVEIEEISLDSDLVDDIGWSNNPEELAFLLKKINLTFDVHIDKSLILGEDVQSVGDLCDLVESEQLG
jgi:acyl carrier protein